MSKAFNVVWIPFDPRLSQNRLFDISCVRDHALERFVETRILLDKNGIMSNTIDLCHLESVDVVIFYGFSSELHDLLDVIRANSNVKLLNIPLEPPIISPMHDQVILSAMPFDRILVWNDDLLKFGDHFVKANYGEEVILLDSIPIVPFSKKKFLSAITSSKLIKHKNGIYQERFYAFDFFSKKPEGIDLYGVGWDKTSYPFVQTSYRGICETKKEVLQQYKFSICFENSKGYLGYITEKIFDCFAAGTVPIYYGAPDVQDYIPKSCFIDFRDFKGYEELYQFLVSMTETQYQSYLDAVKTFIKSPAYYEFTSKRFAEVVLEQVQSLMNEPMPNRTVFGFKWALLKIVLSHPIFFLKNLKRCRRFLFDLAFSF